MKTHPIRPAMLPPEPNEEDIRICAYHLYEKSGREPGHDLDHWLQAVALLKPTVPSVSANRRHPDAARRPAGSELHAVSA